MCSEVPPRGALEGQERPDPANSPRRETKLISDLDVETAGGIAKGGGWPSVCDANQFRQRLPVPRMRSASACADRNGVARL